jgi:transglutaminase-like putative cysteine protease
MATVRIVHTTRFLFDQPASGLSFETRLTPRSHEHHQLVVRPLADERALGADALGNAVWRVALRRSVRRLELSAISTVALEPPRPARPATVAEVQRDDIRSPPSAALGGYAAGCLSSGRSLADALVELAQRIQRDIAHRTDAAGSATAEEVLARRSGSCRDMATVAIACLHHHGIAARYAAGYFVADGAREASAMHAWVTVPCPGGGSVDFDPTLGSLCGARHVLVAVGRDYDDVPPIRGALAELRRQRCEARITFERP